MNKNIAILALILLVLATAAVAIFLLFSKNRGLTPNLQETFEEVQESSKSYLEDVPGTENSFVRQMEPPLFSSDPAYQEAFDEAQAVLGFQIRVPQGIEYGVTQVVAWQNQTQALLAYYENNSGSEFVIQEITEFSPEQLGTPSQKPTLSNGKSAQLWSFNTLGGGRRHLLLFDTGETSGGTLVYYIVDSSDLSPQGVIAVANSTL